MTNNYKIHAASLINKLDDDAGKELIRSMKPHLDIVTSEGEKSAANLKTVRSDTSIVTSEGHLANAQRAREMVKKAYSNRNFTDNTTLTSMDAIIKQIETDQNTIKQLLQTAARSAQAKEAAATDAAKQKSLEVSRKISAWRASTAGKRVGTLEYFVQEKIPFVVRSHVGEGNYCLATSLSFDLTNRSAAIFTTVLNEPTNRQWLLEKIGTDGYYLIPSHYTSVCLEVPLNNNDYQQNTKQTAGITLGPKEDELCKKVRFTHIRTSDHGELIYSIQFLHSKFVMHVPGTPRDHLQVTLYEYVDHPSRHWSLSLIPIKMYKKGDMVGDFECLGYMDNTDDTTIEFPRWFYNGTNGRENWTLRQWLDALSSTTWYPQAFVGIYSGAESINQAVSGVMVGTNKFGSLTSVTKVQYAGGRDGEKGYQLWYNKLNDKSSLLYSQ